MTIKQCLLICGLLLGRASHAELKAQSLADLNTEYSAKRTAGLNGLNENARLQLEAVKKAQMATGNLAGANATNTAVAGLATTAGNPAVAPDTTAEGLPPQAGSILADHSAKVCAGVVGLDKLYIPKYEALKVALLQSGNLDAANAAAAKATQLNEEITTLTPLAAAKSKPGKNATPEKTLTVEGYVDGNTELHITKEGIFWAVVGGESKVGMNDGAKEASFVNGSRWKPKWRTPGDHGPDMSDVFPIATQSPDLIAETASVSRERFGKDSPRTPISTSVTGDHFVISIKDPENGAMWYKIRIKSAKSQ